MKLYSALLALSLIWGMSFLFIKVLLSEMGPWQIVFFRCLLGLIVLIILFFFQKKKMNGAKIAYKPLILVGIFNAGLPWGLIAIGETVLPSGMAAVLNATTPLWTVLMGVAFFKGRLQLKQWFGVIAGFLGIIFLMGPDAGRGPAVSWIGIVFLMVAACCYGFSSQYTKYKLQESGVWITSMATLAVGVLVSAGMMGISGEHLASHVTIYPLLSLLGLGIFGSGIGYLLYYYMIQAGSPEFASLVTYLVPVSALMWGVLLLHESFSWTMVAGLILIFSGVYLTGKKSKKQRPAFAEKTAG